MTGDDLYNFRMQHKLGQVDLGALLNRDRNTISLWEHGRQDIPVAIVALLEMYERHGISDDHYNRAGVERPENKPDKES